MRFLPENKVSFGSAHCQNFNNLSQNACFAFRHFRREPRVLLRSWDRKEPHGAKNHRQRWPEVAVRRRFLTASMRLRRRQTAALTANKAGHHFFGLLWSSSISARVELLARGTGSYGAVNTPRERKREKEKERETETE